tara:strand:+ start:2127 stop:2357 length:231 start_codon:yes stop_codon:yes gene_type:complete
MSRIIGEQIRKAREAREMSQRALGEQVDLSDQMISRIENGHNTTTERLGKIAEVLGICIVIDGGRPASMGAARLSA